MIPDSRFDVELENPRYETLLQMADILGRHRSLTDFFQDVSERLRALTSFDLIIFAFHDAATGRMYTSYWQGSEIFANRSLAVDDTPSGWVWKNQTPLAIPDTSLEPRFAPAMKNLLDAGIRSYCV